MELNRIQNTNRISEAEFAKSKAVKKAAVNVSAVATTVGIIVIGLVAARFLGFNPAALGGRGASMLLLGGLGVAGGLAVGGVVSAAMRSGAQPRLRDVDETDPNGDVASYQSYVASRIKDAPYATSGNVIQSEAPDPAEVEQAEPTSVEKKQQELEKKNQELESIARERRAGNDERFNALSKEDQGKVGYILLRLST